MKNRKRNRMKGYDYSRDNLYFVSICVDKMLCCLGEVRDCDDDNNFDDVGTSRDLSVRSELSVRSDLSGMGAENKSFDNHQNISSRKKMRLNANGEIVQTRLNWLAERYKYVVIRSQVVMPNHVHAVIEINSSLVDDIGIKIKSLSELVGAFKSTSSKVIHDIGFSDFKWKRSFHDVIIRSDKSYQNISRYIDNNPSLWDTDVFNKNKVGSA